MQIDVTPVDASSSKLIISLTREEVDGAIDATYRRLSGRMKIKGFRPGKAPRQMVLRTYGEEDFYSEATGEALRRYYPQALRESGLNAVDSGHLDGDEHAHIEPGKPFAFKALVPIMPELALPDYGEIRIPAPPVVVTQGDVDAIIDALRRARATLEPAPAKAAEVGDVVKMNIRGRAGGADVINAEEYDFELLDGEADGDSPFPGLSKELVGARPGDIREITLALPDDFRSAEPVAGSLILNIVVKAIRRKVLPELNDEFVKSISKHETIGALQARLRRNLEQERTIAAIEKVGGEIVDSLIARSNPIPPEVLVGREQDRMLRKQRKLLEEAGMPYEEYLMAIAKKSEEEEREQLRPAAERSVKQDMILDAVARTEDIQFDEEEVEEEVVSVADSVTESDRDFDLLAESPRLHKLVAQELRRRAAFLKLVETVSGLKPLEDDARPDRAAGEAPVPSETDAQSLEAVAES